MVRLVAGFGVVFGLLGLLAFYCRRRNGRKPLPIKSSVLLKFAFPNFRVKARDYADGPQAHLRVLKRISLTPTHQLHLISTDSTTLLICTHPQGCSVLQQSASPETDHCGENGGFLAELRRHAG